VTDIERERRLLELVRDAIALPEAKRDAFVDEACGSDADLLEKVQALLAEDATLSVSAGAGQTDTRQLPDRTCQTCETQLAEWNEGSTCPTCVTQGIMGPLPRGDRVEIQPGQVFCGYEIVRRLGAGGMGVVYEARQRSLRRSVALKMIRAPGTATPRDLARFRQEAEAAARLDHPNIVEVYEAGEFDGSPFFTMKLVAGARPLSSELEQGALEREQAVTLVCTIARAVGYAHRRGVIHRDLKPLNILLDPAGQPSLVDFGLAKLFGQSLSGAQRIRNLSDDGKLFGTPQYMSPEQVRGQELTTSTDIYSLGVVLYELLTGLPPFNNNGVGEVLRSIAEKIPAPLQSAGRKLPRDLQVICLKCLRKRPEKRYGTADSLADDLQRWLDHEPIQARPTPTAGRVLRWVRRHPGATVLGTITIASTIVAMTTLYWAWKTAADRIESSVRLPLTMATAERADNKAGRRWRALDQLAQATQNLDLLDEAVRPTLRRDLQDEAIACLSLIDLRPSLSPGDTWVGDPDARGHVRLSPDFKRYAHVLRNGHIVLRTRPSNDVILELQGAFAPLCRALRFSPGGLHLAAVHEASDGAHELTLWDLETRRVLSRASISAPDSFDFTSDGRALVFARQGEAVIVPLDGGMTRRAVPLPFAPGALRVDPGRGVLAITPRDGAGVVLIDLETGGRRAVLDGPRVNGLAWNPRGRWLAMGCDDGQMIVWDTEAGPGSPNRERFLASHENQVAIEHVAWHPRGVLVAGTTRRDQVHLWHVAKGELEVFESGVSLGQPQFSADGSRLGPVFDGPLISLLEVAEGRLVSHAKGHPGKIHGAWWRDAGAHQLGRVFATAGDDGVRIWNRRGFELAFLPELGARSALFTADELVITGRDGVSVRSVTGGGRLPGSTGLHLGPARRLDQGLRCFEADYDEGRGVLAVAVDDRVRLHQLETGELIREFTAPAHTAFVDLSPDGQWLAAGTDGGRGVRVWDLASGAIAHDLPVPGSASVDFHHDQVTGRSWLAASGGSEYTFWDTATWEREQGIPAQLGKVHGAISFSPRMPVFAVSEGGWLKVYGLPDFQVLLSPEFSSQDPMAFSPGGFILVTADRRTHLYLWDLRLLRSSLRLLDLDLELPPFPAVADSPLIESVIFE
jgi:WD40 repeat protein